ncbi:hypothetical protein [Paenibacillus harenae]|uniref:hypothetical protein n=1 Tax=Paenibacillus harenae TaxID=306543 RepID=UPI0012EC5A27|nr:hypothetical protein [Paenibacillus harenae]
MSEFTSGHLMLSAHRETISRHIRNEVITIPLNHKWAAFFTPNDQYLEYEDAPSFIYELSKDAPVLYFCNFGDHFWGYRIFSAGREEAYLRFTYELEEEALVEFYKAKYPTRDILALYGEAYDEVHAAFLEQGGLKHAKQVLFQESHVEAFRLFEVPEEQIAKLRGMLTANNDSTGDQKFDLVDQFKACIGMEEMSYLRYDQLLEQDSEPEGDIIDAYVFRSGRSK